MSLGQNESLVDESLDPHSAARNPQPNYHGDPHNSYFRRYHAVPAGQVDTENGQEVPRAKPYWNAPMFATAREIMASHQPYGGDLEPHMQAPDAEASFYEATARDADSRPTRHDPESGLDVGPDGQPMSITESIHATGGRIHHPIMLQDPTAAREGVLGKPEILGGHHRLAVMARDFPDHLMPIQFHNNISEAFSQRDTQGRSLYR